MKRMYLTGVALLTLAGAPAISMAQDKVEASIGADLVSGYIWRGQDLGNVSIQPSASVSYKGFTLSGWGSVGIDKEDTKEFDLTLGYSTGGFSVSVTDYWFNNGPQYFHYGAHNTRLRSSDGIRFWRTGRQLVHQLCRGRRSKSQWRPGLFFLLQHRRSLQAGRPGMVGRNRSYSMGNQLLQQRGYRI